MASRKVTFTSRGFKVAADLYTPPVEAIDRKKAGIVVSHPMTGVKEQTAGYHAKQLAEQGFVTLAFDTAFQGESEGEPRYLEDPSQRVEDIKSAVTYMSMIPEVDPNRIGALGICASGGYVPFAAQTDVRIKAVATVSAVDMGSFIRDGLKGTSGSKEDTGALEESLVTAAKQRIDEAKGGKPVLIPMLPFEPNDPAYNSMPDLIREGSNYYQSPRGSHPRSINRWVARSVDLIVNYDSYAFNRLISPRPLLLIAGSKADTYYHSQVAFDQAKEPKELFEVEGMTHIGLYDDTTRTMPKLVDFFAKNLVA